MSRTTEPMATAAGPLLQDRAAWGPWRLVPESVLFDMTTFFKSQAFENCTEYDGVSKAQRAKHRIERGRRRHFLEVISAMYQGFVLLIGHLVVQGPIFRNLGLHDCGLTCATVMLAIGWFTKYMEPCDYLQGHWLCKMGLRSAADSSVVCDYCRHGF